MPYSISIFQNNTTNQLSALDENFTTFGALVPIPCGVAGTNALTLTQSAAGLVPTPTIQAYSTDMLFSGIAAVTNTGPVTATVGSTGVLNVYKDTLAGPVALTGGEIVANCAFSLRYDAALNSGAGGFHLSSSTANLNGPVSPGGGASLTNLFSGNSPTLTFTATPFWSSQDQAFSVTAALGAPPLPAPGDFMQVSPPSLGATGVDYRGFVLGTGLFSVSVGMSVSATLFSNISVSTLNIRVLNAASATLASNSGVYRYAASRYVP